MHTALQFNALVTALNIILNLKILLYDLLIPLVTFGPKTVPKLKNSIQVFRILIWTYWKPALIITSDVECVRSSFWSLEEKKQKMQIFSLLALPVSCRESTNHLYLEIFNFRHGLGNEVNPLCQGEEFAEYISVHQGEFVPYIII